MPALGDGCFGFGWPGRSGEFRGGKWFAGVGEGLELPCKFGPNFLVRFARAGEAFSTFSGIKVGEIAELHGDGTRGAANFLSKFNDRWMRAVLFPERRLMVKVQSEEELIAGPAGHVFGLANLGAFYR